ncbi:MAG: heavy metal translocating P-type ATPase [Colwellia sp.]|nr:heavy metal translocating P-type ATPase [Colwellia sp.]
MSQNCFHCGEGIPSGINIVVNINEQPQSMCCIGCEAVATTIVDNNLTDYYRFRTESAQTGSAIIPDQLKRNQLLDDENIQNEFTFTVDDYKETILSIDGISCSACAWLIEMQLEKISGVIAINVNATTQRATVRWQEKTLKLSEIITQIETIGYQAFPFQASQSEENNQRQAKAFIKRLGISGILMMQIMMIAVGLYFGAFSGMAEHNLLYLRWVSFILTIPIISYGALPFYQGAIRSLKAHRLSMDVPVSIAISLAFTASVWATISQQGEVYFESVSMFTFLLLIGKFLEFRARSRASEISANLLKLMPMTATQVINNKEVFIAAKLLSPSDVVLIKPGELVPADGLIIHGRSQLNEAMLSGEQLPITKSISEKVYAGTINGDSNLTIEVTQEPNQSFLSQLIRLSESSQAHKPKIAQLSDKIAQYFVALILICAIITALYWYQQLPEQAFWITLSVLVVTCPCALSLATPTALTCATTRLNRDGIMIKSSHVLETMPKVSRFAFDKTGTLTTGEFTITKVILNTDLKKDDVLVFAAALESHSEHPLAKAFKVHRDFACCASNVIVHPGKGVSGNIDGIKFTIGKPSWLLTQGSELDKYKDTQCVLVNQNQGVNKLVAAFYLEDEIRDDAKPLLTRLKEKNIQTIMLSGDNDVGCQKVSTYLPLDSIYSGLSAQDKVEQIKKLQQIPNATERTKNKIKTSNIVAMIGDGVNDTPVFGAAHLSIAMGSGTDIAKNGADVILLNNRLSAVETLLTVAKKNRRIIYQNYSWAFGYNAIVLPLAMAGFITPYMAVIGMSASSLIVISNSLRLLKK